MQEKFSSIQGLRIEKKRVFGKQNRHQNICTFYSEQNCLKSEKIECRINIHFTQHEN